MSQRSAENLAPSAEPADAEPPRWYERERPTRPELRGLSPDFPLLVVLSAFLHLVGYLIVVRWLGLPRLVARVHEWTGEPTWIAAWFGGLAVLVVHLERSPTSTWTVSGLALTATGLVRASLLACLIYFETPGGAPYFPAPGALVLPISLFVAAFVCGVVGLARTGPQGSRTWAVAAILLPLNCVWLLNASVELQGYTHAWPRFLVHGGDPPLPTWSRARIEPLPPETWRPFASVDEDGTVWSKRQRYYDPTDPGDDLDLRRWMNLVRDRMKKTLDPELDREVPVEPLGILAARDTELRHVLLVLEHARSFDVRRFTFGCIEREARHPRPPLFRWHVPLDGEFEIPFPPSGPIAADGARSTAEHAIVRLPPSTRWQDALLEIERALDAGPRTVAIGLDESAPR